MRSVLKQGASKSMFKIIIPVLVVLAGISISWAIAVHRPSLKSELPDSGIPVVGVIEATPQMIKLNIRSQGVVVPRTEIDLVPEVAGQIVRLHPSLAAGGFFEAGDILMMIDTRDYDHAIAEAHARIAEAERQVAMEEAQAEQARQEWQVLGEGMPSPLTMREPQLAEARAKLKAAQADMVKARLQRSRCEWRSPFAGRVRNMHIGLGQYVQPGEKLARLYATDVAQIRLPLATDQFAYLDLLLDHRDNKAERGPRVILSGEFAGVTHRWEGHVIRTEGALDEETGLLHAVAEVQNPYKAKPGQPPLIPGLFVKAEIEGREQADVFVLPPGAVNASQEVLLVDAENRLHIRRVEILRREPDRILAKSGLKAGERLVISRIEVPVEGMKVSAEIVAPGPKLKKTGLGTTTQGNAR
ncbi:RND family efflux transporter MFP subunit [Nitrosospira multiformis]|uniref:RND family efflux transporter MFP subunit n=2 Tax=Nitrosospira multiformis TaxID=1231 RepID=A0A2T5I6D7_9PROT|nr:RND family efflux transporter MFP subunit [Nitrosospira multiformis]